MAPLIVIAVLAIGARAEAQDVGVAGVALPAHQRATLEVRGEVGAIAADEGSWLSVEVGGPSPARFLVIASSPSALPFATGDVIDVRIDCTFPGFHYVCDGIVLDAQGALLFAIVGTGRESVAPGWRLAGDGPTPQRAGRVEQPVILEHAIAGAPPRRITTSLRGWRRLRASDGEWLVSGSYTHHVGRGPRPPDSVDYRQYAITRARPASR